MAAAVSMLSGLGTINICYPEMDDFRAAVRRQRTTDKPFAVSILLKYKKAEYGKNPQYILMCAEKKA